MKLRLPKTVLLLGLTSLANDMASEAIYPLLPVFLTGVLGSSVLFVGLIEGVAESVSSVTKFLSGYYSDRIKNRQKLVFVGYSIATFSRPLIGLITAPWQALAIRFGDRIGKGIRTAPRDAWLASTATPENRGWIFGFHRSMDHAGAFIGPLLASAFLFLFPGNYRALFLVTVIPGILSLFFIAAASQLKQESISENGKKTAPRLRGVWGDLPGSLKSYLFVLLLFTLGNSTDAFLLLRLKSVGVRDAWIPALWAALHVVKMLSSSWGGLFSDRYGRKTSIVLGWLLYAVVYLLIGVLATEAAVIVLFLVYGLYYGLTEGPEKAMVADLVPADRHGTAYGLYNLMIGVGALPASLLFGLIYQWRGFPAAFGFGAALAGAAVTLLLVLPIRPARPTAA